MSEGYVVKVDKMAVIGAEELSAWIKIYCHDYCDHTDMHQLFADEIGQTRVKAKTLAHKIAFSLHRGMSNLGHC